MSFKKWKQTIKKNCICDNNDLLKWWLDLHNIRVEPFSYIIYNKKWICKQIKKKIYLNQYTLYLTVKGFNKVYIHKNISSLKTITDMIHDEYFKIFGNKCVIKASNISILEYKYKLLIIRKYRISANVEAIWKRERASFKINRFIWNHLRGNLIFKKKNGYFDKKLTNDFIKNFSLCELKEHTTDKYHKNIVNYFTRFKSKQNVNPRLVLIFGLPGSGKNWCLGKKRLSDHVSINVDDCRALLPKYWKAIIISKIKKLKGDWVNLFRQECKILASKIFTYALLHRMNIVWNGTGKNYEKYNTILQLAKKYNYIIELRYVWVPIELAKNRVHRRASIIGRIVPQHVIELSEKKIPSSFKALIKDANYARILENTCISPTIVWDKDQGWKGKKIMDLIK